MCIINCFTEITAGQLLCNLSICVTQAKSERNYHIFYEMLAGLAPEEKNPLYLQEAETYYYLNQVTTQASTFQGTSFILKHY